MRALSVVSSMLAVGLFFTAAVAQAQVQEGDTVISTLAVELKVPNAKAGSVAHGEWLNVEKVNDKWLWVKPETGKPGWILTANVVSLDKAVDHFTDAIKKNPRDGAAYAARGVILQSRFEWDKAVADFNAAIEAGHRSPAIYCQRGLLTLDTTVDKAMDDFNTAIKIDPNYAESYGYRGMLWEELGRNDLALADYHKALSIAPQDPASHHELALFLASCPEAKYRNGKQAVTHALKAIELAKYKSWNDTATLAAAYAEAGDFKLAVKHAETVVAETVGDEAVAEAKSRLELYKVSKPYRRPAPLLVEPK